MILSSPVTFVKLCYDINSMFLDYIYLPLIIMVFVSTALIDFMIWLVHFQNVIIRRIGITYRQYLVLWYLILTQRPCVPVGSRLSTKYFPMNMRPKDNQDVREKYLGIFSGIECTCSQDQQDVRERTPLFSHQETAVMDFNTRNGFLEVFFR